MMMNKTLALPARLARRVANGIRPAAKVSLTRKDIKIRFSEALGGELVIVPRSFLEKGVVRFALTSPVDGGHQLVLSTGLGTGESVQVIGKFNDEAAGRKVLAKINSALLSNRFVKWSVRIFIAWLAWLYVSSFAQATRQPSQPVAANDLPAAAMLPPNSQPSALPSLAAAGPAVAMPQSDDLADSIYRQAMAAGAAANQQKLPPQAGDTTTADLAGFGLDGSASPAGGAPAGCDPKLAFHVSK